MTTLVAKIFNRVALPALPIYLILHAAVSGGVL